jgi:hexosaminidase
MIRRLLFTFCISTLSFCFSCNNEKGVAEKDTASIDDLIPKPVQVLKDASAFVLNDSTTIVFKDGSLHGVAEQLADLLRPATGYPFTIDSSARTANSITLSLSGDSSSNKESYELTINKGAVSIVGAGAAGVFYGLQTLRQLLPAAIVKKTKQQGPWTLPGGKISDHPEYAMRGSMLDVARHFFAVEDVKKYIDFLAYYKMNTLHLQLSDDQGWRIEIKKWPRLTEYGGSTQVGGGKGGFYTQDQYKEIVAYAASRFITIVPEIDMPGHTNAALASYPELNCNEKDKNPKLYTGIEVGFSTLCTKNEKVYQFVEDVFTELAAITPGPYLHIGGDESHATAKEDYIPFVNRVQQIVKKTGKQVIGWDEIALSTLQPNTIAQYWADSANSKNAVKQGAKIIISPAAKAYMDMQYDSTTRLGLHWAGYIEVDKAYQWDPVKLVSGIDRKDIIGVMAPLWTETLSKLDDIEYMVFPRLPGYAEIAWSPAEGRTWEEYKTRLGKHALKMKARDIDYYPSSLVPWKE